jgi:hypothetical protein
MEAKIVRAWKTVVQKEDELDWGVKARLQKGKKYRCFVV